MKEQRQKAIDLAGFWLEESGITELDDQHPAYGGVYEGVHRPRGTYLRVHHMVTGFAMSVFAHLYRRTNRKADLELAIQAFEYLQKHRNLSTNPMVYGACTHAYLPSELRDIDTYYSFDNAVILQGLCDLYRETGDDDLLDAATEIASWLVENMQKPDGSFYARVDGTRRKLGYQTISFDGDNGSMHAKHAIGLLRLNWITKESRFLRAAREVLDWTLSIQRPDGMFWANDRMKYVFTYAHCNATEGMIMGSIILEDSKFIESARRAAEALLRIQSADGSMPAVPEEGRNLPLKALNIMLPYKATDATAQAIRIFVIMYVITKEERFLEAARRAEKYLLSVQIPPEAGRKFAGAFYYQEAETAMGLRVRPMLYTWVTQLALFALYWMDDLEHDAAELQHLVRELF